LAARRYHKLKALETPDFVVMFIPVEPAFLVALQQDEGLWRYAYDKEVLLVGPTTLLFVIRIVDNLWQQEVQARGVQDVMDRGAELYDKFVGFVSDLELQQRHEEVERRPRKPDSAGRNAEGVGRAGGEVSATQSSGHGRRGRAGPCTVRFSGREQRRGLRGNGQTC
jgi:DNA anti-recombination protein RmuC